jgi:hypothetical protein
MTMERTLPRVLTASSTAPRRITMQRIEYIDVRMQDLPFASDRRRRVARAVSCRASGFAPTLTRRPARVDL